MTGRVRQQNRDGERQTVAPREAEVEAVKGNKQTYDRMRGDFLRTCDRKLKSYRYASDCDLALSEMLSAVKSLIHVKGKTVRREMMSSSPPLLLTATIRWLDHNSEISPIHLADLQ